MRPPRPILGLALALAPALAACLPARGGIIVNEFLNSNAGGARFDAGEFVELLLTTDYTAAELNGLAFGDSSAATAVKFSHFRLGNLASIAPRFPAGTLLVLAGANYAQDLSYAPQPGGNIGNHQAWNIVLTDGGGFFSQNPAFPLNAFLLAGGGEVVWVDDNDSASNDFAVLHAVAYGPGGAFADAGGNVVRLPSILNLPSGEGVAFQGGALEFLNPASFARTTAPSRGFPQSADNSSFVLSLRAGPPVARSWVTTTAAEFTTTGDFDGDGYADLIVVDRETGAMRVGSRGEGGGAAFFGDPLSSGVSDVTSIAFGDFGEGGLGVAIANPDFNAVNVVSAGRINSAFPVNAIGPRLLVALDGGPSASGGDLITVTSRNDPPDAELLESWTAQLPTPAGAFLEAPNQSAPGARFAFMARGSGDVGGDELWNYASPFDPAPLRIGARSGSDWISFQTSDPGVTILVVLVYGLTELNLTVVTGGTIGAELTTHLPAAPTLAVPLQPVNGVGRFLVIYAGGAGAEIFAFDGTLPLQSVQSIAPPPGEDWRNVALLDSGFALFSGSSPDGRSGRASIYGPDGLGGYLPEGAPSVLPAPPAHNAGNVFAMDGELFVEKDPQFLAVLRADDWSSHPLLLPGSLDVTGESFEAGSTGLGDPRLVSFLSPPPATLYALTNQLASDLSVSSVGGARGIIGPSLRFSPAPGRFPPRDPLLLDDVLPVAIEGPPFAPLWYRTGPGEGWQPYLAPIRLRTDATLEAYADNGGGQRSPIVRGAYLFADGPLPPLGDPDLDGDGLGDAWEKAFAVTDPNADDDGDGGTNRNEHDQGTDPRDPLSTPDVTVFPLELVVTGYNRATRHAHLRVYGTPGAFFRLEWSPSLRDPWTKLTGSDFLIPPAGFLDINDLGAVVPKRFYRAVSGN